MARTGKTGEDAAPVAASTPHALYELADVRATLGGGPADDAALALHMDEGGGLAASRARLRGLLDAGEAGRWRRLAHATPAAISAVEALGARAPHLGGLTAFVVRRLRASLATGTHVALPPLALVGPPGTGKSWYVARLAEALGLPHRLHAFALSTLADGLSGSHPGWRSSAPGLVAKTLLSEEVANPVIVVDEIDKPPAEAHVGDAYRPFYVALEPTCSRRFTDEHLGVPLDASAVSWVATANDASRLPGPILDRLTVIAVPAMRPEELAVVAASIHAEANAKFRGFFDPVPSPDVVARLAATNARGIRLAVEEAMVRAAAEGRRVLAPADVPAPPTRPRPRGAVH